MKWGDTPRDFDPILAVWAKYHPFYDRWILEELAEQGETPPKWRDRRAPIESGGVRMDAYATEAEAMARMHELNRQLESDFEARQMPSEVRTSLRLKVLKNLQARERLANEEALMLAEAKRRHVGTSRPSASDLILSNNSEKYREEITQQLSEMPYLKVVLAGPSTRRILLFKMGNLTSLTWSDPYFASERSAIKAVRARISHCFGLSGERHWGKAKAKIREILLPRANQLLQLAGVQRLLAEHLAAGRRVLVSNGIVFWYEDEGGIGWQVKQTVSASTKEDGATVWEEGTILSTNHGRLVILPYIKESGETVQGHTRNAPHDGRALPRHPDHYVTIPFERLRDDLMIGLMGELPYE